MPASLILHIIIIFISILGVISCASPSPKKNSVSLILVASSDLNPDINGRPSPLALTIYQLASTSSFRKSDYMSLAEKSKSTLGKDLIAMNTVTIRPGQMIELEQSINVGECALGIVAGYRVIDTSGWQLVHEYPQKKTGFLSKFSQQESVSRKVLIEKNRIKLESFPKNN